MSDVSSLHQFITKMPIINELEIELEQLLRAYSQTKKSHTNKKSQLKAKIQERLKYFEEIEEELNLFYNEKDREIKVQIYKNKFIDILAKEAEINHQENTRNQNDRRRN